LYFGETRQFGAGGKTITFYQKENAERKELNESLMRRRVPDGTGTS
jgi:ATP-binding cassette subfamily G (WHITE) protein 2 (SNQ2)